MANGVSQERSQSGGVGASLRGDVQGTVGRGRAWLWVEEWVLRRVVGSREGPEGRG